MKGKNGNKSYCDQSAEKRRGQSPEKVMNESFKKTQTER